MITTGTIHNPRLAHPGAPIANHITISEKIFLFSWTNPYRRAGQVLGYGGQPPGRYSNERWHVYGDNPSERYNMDRLPYLEEALLRIKEMSHRQIPPLVSLDVTALHH